MNRPERVAQPAELRTRLDTWRDASLRVGFVPTMGNLHAGHLALVQAAATHADRVVVSIFVNPMQFAQGEDFASYPRTLDADLERLGGVPCDLVFAPAEEVLYPRGRDATTRIEVPGLSDILCGASRPGHFIGVATVVAKLFNLVQPQLAVFGEKDFQQLLVIRRMTEELCFPIEILGVPTQREADGLAMSSRNRYLGPGERAAAPALFRSLRVAGEAIVAGQRDFVALQQEGMENMRSAGLEPEYFAIRRRQGLEAPGPGDRSLVVLAAARLGRARLIDNLGIDL